MKDYRPEVECQKCHWYGDFNGLVCSLDDFNSAKPRDMIAFNRCPNCDSLEVIACEYDDPNQLELPL